MHSYGFGLETALDRDTLPSKAARFSIPRILTIGAGTRKGAGPCFYTAPNTLTEVPRNGTLPPVSGPRMVRGKDNCAEGPLRKG